MIRGQVATFNKVDELRGLIRIAGWPKDMTACSYESVKIGR